MTKNSWGPNIVQILPGFGFGILWYVWGVKGFWGGVLYGLFWPIWFGYLAAANLLQWQ